MLQSMGSQRVGHDLPTELKLRGQTNSCWALLGTLLQQIRARINRFPCLLPMLGEFGMCPSVRLAGWLRSTP